MLSKAKKVSHRRAILRGPLSRHRLLGDRALLRRTEFLQVGSAELGTSLARSIIRGRYSGLTDSRFLFSTASFFTVFKIRAPKSTFPVR